MRISIIDIGTKSIKHYIFENRKEIYFKRDSTVRLGENILKTSQLDEEKIINTINKIKACLNINQEHNTAKTIIIGTDTLRRADNSMDFINRLKQETDSDIKIISHKEEAELLGKAYFGLIDEDFAAANVGGGSTELVVVKGNKIRTLEFPFGVNKINEEFLIEKYKQGIYNDKEAWNKAKEFLVEEVKRIIPENLKIDKMFLTGVLNFAQKQKSLINFEFDECDIENHPIEIDLRTYIQFNEALKDLGVKKQAENYPLDPGYADNFVIGQEIYITIAKCLNVKKVYPDEVQYIHGLLK